MRVFTDLNTLPPLSNTVITIGSFDGVHAGHKRILERVKTLATSCSGQSLVITFEPHPRTVLRPDDPDFKLITSTSEKIALLEDTGIDLAVLVPFDHEFASWTAEYYVEEFLIRRFRPKYIVIGYDHRFGNKRSGDIQFLRKYETVGGFDVIEIPRQEIDDIAVSSSKIRNALEATDISLANRLLGYRFFLSGTVVRGNQIGRTIGFPTANLKIGEQYKLIPPPGIYAAFASVDRQLYRAMLYIGDRPSVDGRERRVEVNILDFDGYLYDRELTVEVAEYIRPDKKLASLEELKQQIAEDQAVIEQKLENLSPRPLAEPKLAAVVVILNFNTRKHLETYLPSVAAHSGGAKIMVADNGSSDDSIDFVKQRYPDIAIIPLEKNYGFAQGYNEALKDVQADVFILLNSDVEVTPGWITPVLLAMERDKTIGAAQPKVLAWTQKHMFEYAGAAGGWMDALGYPFCRGRIFGHVEPDAGQYNQAAPCFWATGAALFIRADLYRGLGGFDGDYFAHNEEIDLCWRIKRAGYSIWCFPQSVVYHLGGGTLNYESPRKVFLNFRNSLFNLVKNEPFSRLWWLIPSRILLDGLAAARFAIKGQFSSIAALLRAHFSFYSNFFKTIEKRRTGNQLVEKYRIGTEDQSGRLNGSIVWRHYIGRIIRFEDLNAD